MPGVLKLRAWRLAVSGPILFSYFPLFYLILLEGGTRSPVQIALLLLAIVLYFANGFLINDLADRGNDQRAGVRSASRGHDLSTGQMLALILLTGGLSVAMSVAIRGDLIFYSLWAIAFLLSVFYSVPPIAMKRRGLSGAVCDSLIERPLPILIIFSFFGNYGLETIAFPILSELSWSVFKHQIADYDRDKVSGVRTLSVRLGKSRSMALLKWFLNPVSVASQLLLLLIAGLTIPSVRLAMESLGLVYIVGVVIAGLAESRIDFRTTPTDPPYIMFSNFAYKLLILPTMAFFVIVRTPELLFLGVALLISLLPHIRDYYHLAPTLYARVRGREAP